MAPSFDCPVSSLLCAEEDTSIFGDDSYGGFVDDFEIGEGENRNQPNLNQDHSLIGGGGAGGVGFAGCLPVQLMSEDCLAAMFEKENHHLPGLDYLRRLKGGDLDLEARNQAIDWIQKVHSHYKFGALCLYVSINYMDRFLSVYQLPGKAWMMQLLAVACLSIAAKMEETEVPLSLDLQVGEAKSIFEAKTIQRMELLVLGTLKWRMQAVTPFSFIDHFLYKMNGDRMPPTTLIFQSIQLIQSTSKGIELLEFKPSEIAAAVAISVTEETQIVEHPVIKALSFLSDHVEKERLIKCVELINGLKGVSGSASASVPQSPIGVLDAACLSYKSDDTDTSTPSASSANSTRNSPAAKRRRLDKIPQLQL